MNPTLHGGENKVQYCTCGYVQISALLQVNKMLVWGVLSPKTYRQFQNKIIDGLLGSKSEIMCVPYDSALCCCGSSGWEFYPLIMMWGGSSLWSVRCLMMGAISVPRLAV